MGWVRLIGYNRTHNPDLKFAETCGRGQVSGFKTSPQFRPAVSPRSLSRTRMAPLKQPATPEDLELLKTVHDALRSTREQPQSVNLDISHLLSLKSMQIGRSAEESEAASQLLTQHLSAEFDNQDPWEPGPDHADRWHGRNGVIIKSHELLDQDLTRANASKAALEGVHDALQGSMNRLSRPYLRNLTILDLPDEILLEIFAHLESNSLMYFSPCPYRHWSPPAEIKALRLVCRRTSDIASHILVRVVHLNLHEESSLKRLEQISRHPAIANGVRAISIKLMFYNHSFTDMQEFLGHHAFEIDNTVGLYKQCRMWELDGKIPEEEAAKLMADARDLVSTLYQLASGNRDEYLERHALHVSKTHRLYLELLQRQDLLLQGEALYQAVGSAMARMPCARSLVFNDADFDFSSHSTRQIMTPGVDIWESLRSKMLAPLTGYSVQKNHLDPPSLQCVTRLINAVRQAGASLHHLDIKLSSLRRSIDLVPSPDSRLLFSSGMRQLRSFRLVYESDSVEESGEANRAQNLNSLVEFLSACLDTSSLQSLDLDMRVVGHYPLRLKDIFNQKKSADKLTDVFLRDWELDYMDLAAFLRRLPAQMRRFSMHNVRLQGGSWREVLDAVREKGCIVASLKRPTGAECEDMTKEEYKRLFEEEVGFTTLAEMYMSGRRFWMKNPVEQDYTAGVEDDATGNVE
jgi:hypothetical protein